MVKQVPMASVHADNLAWRPWSGDRAQPFVAEGAQGDAWVKVLSRDPKTESESLLYRLDRGWSAEKLRNTVYENLVVIDGQLNVGDQTLRKYAFSYRPEGHEVGPVSTTTGAVVFAIAGSPGELSSKIPVEHLDTEAMPWVPRDVTNVVDHSVVRAKVKAKDAEPYYYVKILRGDEENLDMFLLMRVVRGFEAEGLSSHDAPEEAFQLEGKTMSYDEATGGRQVHTRGTYVHRHPGSAHGDATILEDTLVIKHDYFNPEDNPELFYAAYPKDTAAVTALKEGRDPGLPARW
jgi:Domain of unknown function (DUF4437)